MKLMSGEVFKIEAEKKEETFARNEKLKKC